MGQVPCRSRLAGLGGRGRRRPSRTPRTGRCHSPEAPLPWPGGVAWHLGGLEGGQWFGPEGPVVVGDEPDPDVPVVERGILLIKADPVDCLTPNADQVGGCAVLGDGQL